MVIPFLSVYLTTKFSFSLGQVGTAMAIFGLGGLAGSFLGGYLTDKIGYHPVMSWSLLLGGGMFIGLGYVSGVKTIYATIFILSTIVESFRPATMTAVGAYSKPEHFTRSFSLLRMSINLGWTVGPAIGGILATTVGYSMLFWADGLTCILAAFAFHIFLKPKKSRIEKKATAAAQKTKAPSPFQDRIFLVFLLLSTAGTIIFMQISSTLPVFYKQEWQFSEAVIGAILALNGLMVFLLEMPLVLVLERKINGLTSIGLGVLMYGLAYLILNLPFSGVVLAVLSIVLLSVGEIFNMPFINTFAMNRSTEGNRGTYMGLHSMSIATSQIAGPFLSLKIAGIWGFSALWYLLGVFSVVIFFGFRILKKFKEK